MSALEQLLQILTINGQSVRFLLHVPPNPFDD